MRYVPHVSVIVVNVTNKWQGGAVATTGDRTVGLVVALRSAKAGLQVRQNTQSFNSGPHDASIVACHPKGVFGENVVPVAALKVLSI